MFRVLCMLQLWVLKQYKSNFATFPHFVCATKKFVFWKIGLALKKTKNWKNSSFSIADLSMPVHISNLYKHWIKSFNSHNLWHFTTFLLSQSTTKTLRLLKEAVFLVSNVSEKCFWLRYYKKSLALYLQMKTSAFAIYIFSAAASKSAIWSVVFFSLLWSWCFQSTLRQGK